MLSKFLASIGITSAKDTTQQAKVQSDSKMVTTRSTPKFAETKEEDVPYELLTNSTSRKRRREAEQQAGQDQSKKSKSNQSHTHVELEVPTSQSKDGTSTVGSIVAEDDSTNGQETSHATPSRTRSSRKPLGKKAALRALKPSATQINSAVSNILGKPSAPSQDSSDSQPIPSNNRSSTSSRISEKVPNTTVGATGQATPIRPKHRKFGSEEPEELLEEQSNPLLETKDQPQESEEDDDSAPEEVDTGAVEQNLRNAERQAAKVAHEKELSEKNKRKILQQTRVDLKYAAEKRRAENSDAVGRISQVEEQEEEEEEEEPSIARGRFNKLPLILPEEFLSDTEDIASIPPMTERRIKKKHLKFQDAHPKDVQIGRTTVKVARKSTGEIYQPPMRNANAKATKDSLLQRRVLQDGGVRRKSKNSFYVKKR